MKKTAIKIVGCSLFAAVFLFAFLTFAPNLGVAQGATATVQVSVDDVSSYMPFDLDYTLNVMDENGKVVKSVEFNGIPDTPKTFSLTVGQKYSMAVYAPTSVFCAISLGNNEFNTSYIGDDFVMPNSTLNVTLVLYTQNPTIFTNTIII